MKKQTSTSHRPIKPRNLCLHLRILSTVAVLSCGAVGLASAQVVEHFSKAEFLAALRSPEIIDFDSLPANSILNGLAFVASGVLITNLDGLEINVISSPPVPTGSCSDTFFSSLPNAISSSYASVARPDFTQTGCNLWFNDNTNNICFTFTNLVSAAGIFFGENDVQGLTIKFFDSFGNIITNRFFSVGAPLSGYYGIVSEAPIRRMEVSTVALHDDGMSFDDLIFQHGCASSLTPAGFGAGGFTVILTGSVGCGYRLQASSLLTATNWSDVLSVTLTTATTNLLGSTATNYSIRFYRVVSP